MATGEEDEGRSCLPRPLAPMHASLGSGPVATSPPSAPPSAFGSCSSGGGRGCVPQEGQRPGGGRASGRGTSVWQVSEAAGTGVSSGEASSALPRRCRDPSGARPDSAVLWSPRPTPSPPRAPPGLQLAPDFADPPFSHSGWGHDVCCPPHLSRLLMKLQPPKRSLLRVRWVGRPPLLF